MHSGITVQTDQERQVIDVTDQVDSALDSQSEAIVILFVQHTTCALSTADLDPGGTDQDYLHAMTKMIPDITFRHPHNPEHMPAHILSTLVGTSLCLPVVKGKISLGTWQRIVLMEFDGPRERHIMMTVLSKYHYYN